MSGSCLQNCQSLSLRNYALVFCFTHSFVQGCSFLNAIPFTELYLRSFSGFRKNNSTFEAIKVKRGCFAGIFLLSSALLCVSDHCPLSGVLMFVFLTPDVLWACSEAGWCALMSEGVTCVTHRDTARAPAQTQITGRLSSGRQQSPALPVAG